MFTYLLDHADVDEAIRSPFRPHLAQVVTLAQKYHVQGEYLWDFFDLLQMQWSLNKGYERSIF
jgi:hypothetical protein